MKHNINTLNAYSLVEELSNYYESIGVELKSTRADHGYLEVKTKYGTRVVVTPHFNASNMHVNLVVYTSFKDLLPVINKLRNRIGKLTEGITETLNGKPFNIELTESKSMVFVRIDLGVYTLLDTVKDVVNYLVNFVDKEL